MITPHKTDGSKSKLRFKKQNYYIHIGAQALNSQPVQRQKRYKITTKPSPTVECILAAHHKNISRSSHHCVLSVILLLLKYSTPTNLVTTIQHHKHLQHPATLIAPLFTNSHLPSYHHDDDYTKNNHITLLYTL